MSQWKKNHPEANDPQYASTVAQGISLLRSFQIGDICLCNKTISIRTGLAPNTVSRLASTLIQLGYLRRDGNGKNYCLAPGLLSLAYPFLANLHIRQIARPLMANLAQKIHGAVSLVMYDNLSMIYVETARANNAMTNQPDIGSSLPMLSTAAGRSWLSKIPSDKRLSVINRLRLRQPEHYASHYDNFLIEQKRFEQAGYCSNNKHWLANLYGFAVPLKQCLSGNLFIFNCGIHSDDGDFETIRKNITPKLLHLVRDVESLLGFHTDKSNKQLYL